MCGLCHKAIEYFEGKDVDLATYEVTWGGDSWVDSVNARAMRERIRRRMTRIAHLAPDRPHPLDYWIWRFGDAVWIALDGEHYNVLQSELRRRFPDRILIIGTLANGSKAWYLPDSESYGKGLYQETASVLRKGSLELLIDSLAREIETMS